MKRAAAERAETAIAALSKKAVSTKAAPIPKPEYIALPTFSSERDELHSMPEAASIMLAVCAVAPYLRMRTFTLRELEDGLLHPEGSELMNLFLSRWLIRDPKIRQRLGPTEGMDPTWVSRMMRDTVRAWFRRASEVRHRVDSLLAAVSVDPSVVSLGEAWTLPLQGSRSALDGSFLQQQPPSFYLSAPYDDNDWSGEGELAAARAARAVREEGVLLQQRGSDVEGRGGGIEGGAAGTGGDADDERVNELEGGVQKKKGRYAAKNPRGSRELADLHKGVESAARVGSSLAGLGGGSRTSYMLGDRSSGHGGRHSRASLSEGTRGLLSYEHQVKYVDWPPPPSDYIQGLYEAASNSLEGKHWRRVIHDPQPDVFVKESDLILSQCRVEGEADEREVDELFWWDALLEPLGWVPLDSPAHLVSEVSGKVNGDAGNGSGGSGAGATIKCPLAHTHWGDLPLRQRMRLLSVVLEARMGASASLFGGWDDIASFVLGADVQDAIGDPTTLPSSTLGLAPHSLSTPLCGIHRKGQQQHADPDRLRMRYLGGDYPRKARFFSFPLGTWESEVRVFMEVQAVLRNGRKTRVWSCVADDPSSLAALAKAAAGAGGGGEGRKDKKASSSTPTPTSPSSSSQPCRVIFINPDVALVTALNDAVAEFSKVEESTQAKEAKEKEREARRAALLAANGPRRTSARFSNEAGEEGGGQDDDGGGREEGEKPFVSHDDNSTSPGPAPFSLSPLKSNVAQVAFTSSSSSSSSSHLAAVLAAPITASLRRAGAHQSSQFSSRPPGESSLALLPSFQSAQVEVPSERRSALQRLETTISVTHTSKVAALAEIVDLDPEGLRYIGMPPTCLPFRPVVLPELQRLSDIKASVGDLEVAKVKRKGKEEDKRRRDKELKEREREAQEKAERGKEAAELSLQAAREERMKQREQKIRDGPPIFTLPDPSLLVPGGPCGIKLQVKVLASHREDCQAYPFDLPDGGSDRDVRGGYAAPRHPELHPGEVRVAPLPLPSPQGVLNGGGGGSGSGGAGAIPQYTSQSAFPLRSGLDAARAWMLKSPKELGVIERKAQRDQEKMRAQQLQFQHHHALQQQYHQQQQLHHNQVQVLGGGGGGGGGGGAVGGGPSSKPLAHVFFPAVKQSLLANGAALTPQGLEAQAWHYIDTNYAALAAKYEAFHAHQRQQQQQQGQGPQGGSGGQGLVAPTTTGGSANLASSNTSEKI